MTCVRVCARATRLYLSRPFTLGKAITYGRAKVR
jgi:hypothetical protein